MGVGVLRRSCTDLFEFPIQDLKSPAVVLRPERVSEREWQRKNRHEGVSGVSEVVGR